MTHYITSKILPTHIPTRKYYSIDAKTGKPKQLCRFFKTTLFIVPEGVHHWKTQYFEINTINYCGNNEVTL